MITWATTRGPPGPLAGWFVWAYTARPDLWPLGSQPMLGQLAAARWGYAYRPEIPLGLVYRSTDALAAPGVVEARVLAGDTVQVLAPYTEPATWTPASPPWT